MQHFKAIIFLCGAMILFLMGVAVASEPTSSRAIQAVPVEDSCFGTPDSTPDSTPVPPDATPTEEPASPEPTTRAAYQQLLDALTAYMLAQGNQALTPESAPEPTVEPTIEPTSVPTQEPTTEPTLEPTVTPTDVPTEVPTVTPTEEPTDEPTAIPTAEPTAAPTEPSDIGRLVTVIEEQNVTISQLISILALLVDALQPQP